jgi:outer membrane receptor protein involved in Fe transport
MRRFLMFLILGTTVIAVKAQTHGVVKGIVLDSVNKQPLEYVTVAVLKEQDTSLLSYTITDKNGAFTLRNLREDEPSRLLISYVGYQSLHITLSFNKNPIIDLGDISIASKTLKEVIITDAIPVIIKKDTIEFNAEAFKTRPNAVVEDLLKKLPGIQVDHDGHIMVNGKDISKIKVDGKDFFVNDPKIATKNLDADMISKVQVYDDRENDPDHLEPEYKVKKIINLKFKVALKRSTFGNVVMAAGTQERYEANGFFSKFEDDLQISANANSNNLSGTGVFSDEIPRASIFNGGPNSGIKQQTNSTFNINDNLSKQLKLNLNYELYHNNDNNRSIVNRAQFVGDTTFNTNSKNEQHQISISQSLHAKLEWTPDTATNIKYSPDLIYHYNRNNNSNTSISSNNFFPILNKSVNSDYSHSNSVQFQHNLSYYRKLNNQGASLSISNDVSISPDHSLGFTANDLLSYTAALQSDTLRRSAKNTNNTSTVGFSVAYHQPITKKLSADISVAGNHNRNEGDLLTYDQDLRTGLYNIYLPDQSSDLIRNEWQQTAYADVNYNFNDNLSLKAGLRTQFQQINNEFNNLLKPLDQHFFYLLPTAELHADKVNISYSQDIQQPSINDLQPVTIVYSQLFSFIGNPALKPTRRHNFEFSYFDFKMQSQLFLNLSARFVIEANSILRERTINGDGVEVTRPINRNGRFTTYINASIGKTFKKHNDWQLRTTSYLGGSFGHNFFEVNHQDGYQNTTAVTYTQEFSADYKDLLEIRPAYSISPSVTNYQLVEYKGVSYITHRANLAIDLHLSDKWTWNTAYAYTYNPLVAQGFQRNSNLLSLSLARRIQKKDKGELRITCYDLLNQSVNTFHYASENTVNDIQNQSLRRYFLLTYSYRFSTVNSK